MKVLSVGIGMAAGMAMAAAAISCLYPDVSRRMMRDGRRIVHCTKKRIEKIMG